MASDLVVHKPGSTATEDGWRLEISDLESRGIVLYISVAKAKALINFVVISIFIYLNPI